MKIFDDIIHMIVMSSIALVIAGGAVIFLIFGYKNLLGKDE